MPVNSPEISRFTRADHGSVWAIIDFYRSMLPLRLDLSGFFTPTACGVTFVLATVLLFGYVVIPSLLVESDMASQLIARTSVMAIPPLVILLWHRIVQPPAAG